MKCVVAYACVSIWVVCFTKNGGGGYLVQVSGCCTCGDFHLVRMIFHIKSNNHTAPYVAIGTKLQEVM